MRPNVWTSLERHCRGIVWFRYWIRWRVLLLFLLWSYCGTCVQGKYDVNVLFSLKNHLCSNLIFCFTVRDNYNFLYNSVEVSCHVKSTIKQTRSQLLWWSESREIPWRNVIRLKAEFNFISFYALKDVINLSCCKIKII